MSKFAISEPVQPSSSDTTDSHPAAAEAASCLLNDVVVGLDVVLVNNADGGSLLDTNGLHAVLGSWNDRHTRRRC